MSKSGIIVASSVAFSLAIGAANASKMYWPSLETLTFHRANLNGTAAEDLGTSEIHPENTLVLDPQGGKIYWPSEIAFTIRRANLDGSAEEDLGTSLVFLNNTLALDPQGGKMYWPSDNTFTIHRANLDGTDEEDLGTSSVPFNNTLVLDPQGGKMYWPSNATSTIHRANLDGTDEEDLGTSFVSSNNTLVLDLQGAKMYWPSNTTSTIHRANLDGTDEQDLGTTSVSLNNTLVLDSQGGKMYWPSDETGSIHRASLDGAREENLGTTIVDSTNSLALDPESGKIFWPSSFTDTIHRANLDGTVEENLPTSFVETDTPLVLEIGLGPDDECAGDGYSNLPDQLGHGVNAIVGATSDLNPNAGFRVAERVEIAASGAVTGVCWWGVYVDFNARADCGVATPGDGGNSFVINYYNDDAEEALPGTLRAGPFAVGDGSPTQTGLGIISGFGFVVEWTYSVEHAPVAVTAEETLWIEIYNTTTGVCFWLWTTAPSVAEGGAGDGRSAQDLNNGMYEPGEEQDFDLALTLSLNDCPWDCADNNDVVGTVDLVSLLGQWGSPGSCDFDGDGVVNAPDLIELLGNWGPCPE